MTYIDPLHVQEDPPPPRRQSLGCSVFLLSLIVFLASVVPASGSITTEVTRTGTWAYAERSYGSLYLAIPEGRGWDVVVCGPLGCLNRVSTDAGPELYLQRAGRIGDLSAAMFEEICGPLSAGLCPGGWYTITGRADQSGEDPPRHPDDDRMRVEDGGPAPTLPATDMEGGSE